MLLFLRFVVNQRTWSKSNLRWRTGYLYSTAGSRNFYLHQPRLSAIHQVPSPMEIKAVDSELPHIHVTDAQVFFLDKQAIIPGLLAADLERQSKTREGCTPGS